MRNWITVVIAQRHPIALWRTVPHCCQELESGQEGVNAHALAGQFLEVGLLCWGDVFEITAHDLNKRSPYVAVRLREHEEGQATGPSMGDWVACLRGWHPALSKAELAALLPEASLATTNSNRWVRVSNASLEERNEARRVASGLQCFLVDGTIHSTESITTEAWFKAMGDYLDAHPVEGSVAVRGWKQGGKIKGWSLSGLSGTLGGMLHDRGNPVDLEQPDHTLALIADGPNASVACGWMEGDGQAAFSNGERRAGERPYFKPVSLDPMLARLAVNLAAGPVGNGPVVDPMTGTGGFLIEASLSGRKAVGLDIHSAMVQGAQANLAWAHGGDLPEHARVRRGDATRLEDALPEEWLGNVAGFVLDPPYGRNSHGSMAADSLLEAALISARKVAARHAGFVLIVPMHPLDPHPMEALSPTTDIALLNGTWSDLLECIKHCGWAVQSIHAERVHRSLSRLILHAKCAPRD